MIVSLNWLKQFTRIEGSVDELAQRIGARLVEIESVIDVGKRYDGIVVAKVVRVADHPDADRLHVVEIDDGQTNKTADRLENGNVQVVCGAPNVREGMLVAWVPPGSVVPSTSADADPFVLEKRKLRGVLSNGMLASAKELAFSDEHDGIVEIDKEAAPGDSFTRLYELDDHLLDIENKSLTHRPDCFGLIGFAREVAAIQGKEFTTPKWLQMLEPVLGDKVTVGGIESPTVTIEQDDICQRYQAVVLAGVDTTTQSPLQIQSYLSRVGMRPINTVVDTTNYLMLLTGQPLHAFDYDKFVAVSSTHAPDVTVRQAKKGEELTLLDNRTLSLTTDDIVICAGTTPVALAGAMGGNSTEIDVSTKNIILESATFDLYRLRLTQMRHGIFSEAITRYTKGLPAPQTAPVLASAVRMICDIARAQRASDIIDEYPRRHEAASLRVPLRMIQGVLGDPEISMSQALRPLECTEFGLDVEAPYTLVVTPPYWRADIHIKEDVIEEIGRIRGFDTIMPQLPQRRAAAVEPIAFDAFRARLRRLLARAGANEILSYSFVHNQLLEKANQTPQRAFQLTNALSPDLHCYRLSIVPSLLEKVYPNLRQQFTNFALFEVGKVHEKDQQDPIEAELPVEKHSIGLVLAAQNKSGRQAAFYEAKTILDYMTQSVGVEATYEPYVVTDIAPSPVVQPFEPKRTARVMVGGVVLGYVGEFASAVGKAFKLPHYSAGFEIDSQLLFKLAPERPHQYRPLSRFPGTSQDICVQTSPEHSYGQILRIATDALKDETLEWSISPVDIFRVRDEDYKRITIRVYLTNHERTITTDEASIVMAYVKNAFVDSGLGLTIV